MRIKIEDIRASHQVCGSLDNVQYVVYGTVPTENNESVSVRITQKDYNHLLSNRVSHLEIEVDKREYGEHVSKTPAQRLQSSHFLPAEILIPSGAEE